jgi:hypothetical protein
MNEAAILWWLCGAMLVGAAACGGNVAVETGEGGSSGSGAAHASSSGSGAATSSGVGVGGGSNDCAANPGAVTIAAGEDYPTYVAIDATHAYWSTDTQIRRAPRGGGPVETLAQSLTNPMGVAVDDTHVYWASYGDDKVQRVPKGGGSWRGSRRAQATVEGTIKKVPLTGGAPITLVAAADAQWYDDGWSDVGGGIAVDADSVYWMAFASIRTVGRKAARSA